MKPNTKEPKYYITTREPIGIENPYKIILSVDWLENGTRNVRQIKQRIYGRKFEVKDGKLIIDGQMEIKL